MHLKLPVKETIYLATELKFKRKDFGIATHNVEQSLAYLYIMCNTKVTIT